jgi:hypothetical protein
MVVRGGPPLLVVPETQGAQKPAATHQPRQYPGDPGP